MSETWLPAPGFPDYAVSDLGNVMRVKADRHGRNAGKMLSPTLGNHGYLVVSLHRAARQSVKPVHRLACEAFHGPAPSGRHQAAHSDGNRLNNAKGNLRWATPSENNMDKVRHGTMRSGVAHPSRIDPSYVVRGTGHPNSKLTDEAVRSIRTDQRPQRHIAADYGVTQSLISMVKAKQIWAHIGENS